MIRIRKGNIEKIREQYGDEIYTLIQKTKSSIEKDLSEHKSVTSYFNEIVHYDHENIHFTFLEAFNTRLHNHNFYEIIYALTDSIVVYIDENYYLLDIGDALIVPPSVLHCVETADIYSCAIFAMRKEWLIQKANEFEVYDKENYLSQITSKKIYSFFSNTATSNFHSIMQKLVDIHRSVYRNASLDNNLYFEYLFALALVALTKAKIKTPKEMKNETDLDSKITNIIEYIVTNYNKTSVEDVAEHFGYSKTQIHRLVKSSTGITVSNHITNEKMKRAKVLLLNSNLSITAIAEELGFENPDCFAKMFKRLRGITPYQYRKWHPYVGNRSSIKD